MARLEKGELASSRELDEFCRGRIQLATRRPRATSRFALALMPTDVALCIGIVIGQEHWSVRLDGKIIGEMQSTSKRMMAARTVTVVQHFSSSDVLMHAPSTEGADLAHRDRQLQMLICSSIPLHLGAGSVAVPGRGSGEQDPESRWLRELRERGSEEQDPERLRSEVPARFPRARSGAFPEEEVPQRGLLARFRSEVRIGSGAIRSGAVPVSEQGSKAGSGARSG